MIPKQYLGAFKVGHRESAKEFIDEELSFSLLEKIIKSEWTDQVSMDALAYITKFNNEFHKNVIKKGDNNALHNTDALRKQLYARENARNRDITSLQRRSFLTLDSDRDSLDGDLDTQLVDVIDSINYFTKS